jgi:EF hand
MRGKLIWLSAVSLLLMAILIIPDGEAQGPPGGKGGKGPKGKKGGFGPASVTADQIVDRIMSFDKNGDGKITAEMLPERMQHLVALGDVNKDGALDKDEIRKLATTLESFTNLVSLNGPGDGKGGKGFGPKGPKGPLKGAVKGATEVQRTIEELNLVGATRDKADRLFRAYQEKVRRTEEIARADLVVAMKDVLTDGDYRVFKSSVDFQTGPPAGKGPRPDDVNERIEQLQKDLDELRNKIGK